MMPPAGLAGTLVSGAYAATLLQCEETPDEQRAIGALARWWRVVQARCGPASSPRALADVAAAPLALALGYTLRRATALSETHWIAVLEAAGVATPIVITTWGGSLDRAWRASVRQSLSLHARWCFLFNGTHLRLLDAGRTFARRHIDFDLESLADSAAAARLLIVLASAGSLRPPAADRSDPDPLAAIVAASDAHGQRVCVALRGGVHQALEHLLAALVESRRGRRARTAPRVPSTSA